MGIEQIIFYFFAGLVLLSALLVVTIRNLVRSIFLFFVTVFALAGLFVFALADFIAITQIVVYVGGVLVLMLFAFMLSNREMLNSLSDARSGFRVSHLAGIMVSLAVLGLLGWAIHASKIAELGWLTERPKLAPTDNTIHQIGINTMTRYLLPFEVVSVFLMMALIGAAHLARKEKRS